MLPLTSTWEIEVMLLRYRLDVERGSARVSVDRCGGELVCERGRPAVTKFSSSDCVSFCIHRSSHVQTVPVVTGHS